MKKWLIAIVVVIILLLGSVYFFIPNYIFVHQNITIIANKQGLQRVLFTDNSWAKWWSENPAPENNHNSNFLTYNGNSYYIRDKTFTSLFISVSGKDINAITSLNLISLKLDSTNLDWETRIPTSYNPLKRLKIYLSARQLSHDMKTILEKTKSFFSKTENVYGYNIRKTLVVDSTLISTFSTSKGYPGIEFIYGLIDQLKNYISFHSAKETGFPMLNISTTDSINFLTRVAIPVNKILPSSGNITYKWMLGRGNILVVEVHGGPSSITNAFHQIENYASDYQRMAPAIPFLSLVTDRSQQPDTTKWVTRIYYPVM